MSYFSIHTDRPLPAMAEARLLYTIDFINNHPFTKLQECVLNLNQETDRIISYTKEKNKRKHFIFRADQIFQDVNKLEESDVLESIFFHVSRFEERFMDFQLFLNDRKSYEDQLYLVRNGLEKTPIVDHLVQDLITSLCQGKINTRLQAPVHLTHDVDFVEKFTSPWSILRKTVGHLYHRRTLKNLDLLWNQFFDKKKNRQDPFDTFEWLLSERSMEKTIYFLRGKNHSLDNFYESNHATFRKALRTAEERQYNIGIHPSYLSYNKGAMMSEEKQKLERECGQEITRSRQHFLNFKVDETPQNLEKIGIKEDSSLGYTRYVGFRCGTGFSYKLYDFQKERPTNVIEKPLVFMDTSWFHESKRQGSWKLPDLSNLYGTFNFHNSTFDDLEMRGIEMKQHYLRFFGVSESDE